MLDVAHGGDPVIAVLFYLGVAGLIFLGAFVACWPMLPQDTQDTVLDWFDRFH